MVKYFFKRHGILVLIVAIIITLVVLNYSDKLFEADKEMSVYDNFEQNKHEAPNIKEEVSSIIVDVKGSVKSPGIYEVGKDVRVNDIIILAGGFTDDANEDHINLAQRVFDEMVIYIPSNDDNTDVPMAINNSNDKIRINYATKEEIEQLNGIGPSKANAIIEYREEHGYFQSEEDLLNVSGIGEKTLENIRADIQIP